MKVCYLIVSEVTKKTCEKLSEKIKSDLAKNNSIQQVFFYSDAVTIASKDFPQGILDFLIDLSDSYGFEFKVCAGAFKSRDLDKKEFIDEDLEFMGLARYLIAVNNSDEVRVL